MRECKGPRPPNSAQGPHSERGQPLAPHHNIQLTLPTLVPTPVSTVCCCVLTPPGPLSPLQASRTPSPEGFIPVPPLPSAPVAATSLRLGFPLSSWPPATAPTPCVGTTVWGLVSVPSRGRHQHTGLVLTFMNQLSVPSKWHQNTAQVTNSSTKSLYRPLEAFRVWLSGSNHSPRRYPQACGKDYQQWLSPLLHPARKGPFHCLGDLQSW